MYKRFASVLWLCAAPLFAQQPAMQMPGMPMEKPSCLRRSCSQGVASRAPLKLEDFLAMADRNNPTLQQAAAIVRRSEARSQAGCALPQSLQSAMKATRFAAAPTGAGNRAALLPKPSCWVASSAFAATSMSSRSSLIRSQPRPSSRACTTT